MKQIRYIICIVLSSLCLLSCDDMLDNIKEYLDEGETIYVGKLYPAGTMPGRNRILVGGYYLMGVTQKKCVISWVDLTDELQSVEVDVEKDEEGFFQYIVEGLDEGQYDFSIVTYDGSGNKSVPVEVGGYAYGNIYEAGLVNRTMRGEIEISHFGSALVSWGILDDSDFVWIEARYTGVDGEEVTVLFPPEETESLLEDYLSNSIFKWRTVYMPGGMSVDEFYSDWGEAILPDPDRETELNKSLFANLLHEGNPIPGDVKFNYWNMSMSNVWDNNYGNFNHSETDEGPLPHSGSIDLGTTIKLTSFKLWQRPDSGNEFYYYSGDNPKTFEIWGREDDPREDPGMTVANPDHGWTKLGQHTIARPSGITTPRTSVDDLSAEDRAAAENGHEIVFENGTPYIRYIRIKVTENWSGNNVVHYSEIGLRGMYR